jgi:hypothetical protein
MIFSWDFIITIAVTAFITSTFNAIAQYFVYKFLIRNLDSLGDLRNGKKTKKGMDVPHLRK